MPQLDRKLAKRVVDELCAIQADVHRPVVMGLPPLSDDEESRLKHVMGFAFGYMYIDLMIPLIRLYPDIDPDRDRVPPPGDSPASGAGPTRAEFGARLVMACQHALQRLDSLGELVETDAGQAESDTFAKRSAQAKLHLRELIDFASGLG